MKLQTLILLLAILGIYGTIPVTSSGEPDSKKENIPYEIVPIHKVESTGRRPGVKGPYDGTLVYRFDAFGEIFHLQLTENEQLLSGYGYLGMPVLTVDDSGEHYSVVHLQEMGLKFYQDIDRRAAFAVSKDTTTLEGLVLTESHEIVVRPFYSEIPQRNKTNDLQHIVYKRNHSRAHWDDTVQEKAPAKRQGFKTDTFNPASLSSGLDPAMLLRKQMTDMFQYRLHSQQEQHVLHSEQGDTSYRNSPTDATVEVFVWTDYAFYQSFLNQSRGGNVEMQILQYIAIMVNAADLRYQIALSDTSMNVSLVLTGTLICKTRSCSTFTENYQMNNTVDNHIALDHFAEVLKTNYVRHKFHFRYDFAAAITRLDITDPNGTPIGVAFTDAICSVEDGRSSAIVEDQGGFSSVGTLVHELSHTLGSDHDGWFRAQDCNSADGYIMSIMSPLTKHGFFFSNCSVKTMKENLLLVCHFVERNKTPPVFLINQSTTNYIHFCPCGYPDRCTIEQNNVDSFMSVGTTLEDICYKMYCWDPYLKNVCSTKTPAAYGTSCGKHKWCVGGKCVYDDHAP